METIIKWNDGEGNIVATYSGSGNALISLTSDTPNEGIDREQEINVSATRGGDASAKVLVRQVGLREVYNVQEGAYLLADGGTYNVLKQ